MTVDDLVPLFLVAFKPVLAAVAVVFFISGLDDLFVDLYYGIRTLYRRLVVLPRHRPLTEEQLLARPEQPMAIMIPAWDESAVIGRMLDNVLRTLNYSNYQVFVGTYPNDPKTQTEVELVRERYDNVQRVVCPKNGPTNKADCLNWIYQGIRLYEQDHGVRFEAFVIQDSEDLVHPLSMKLFNYLIPRMDMVQLPVLPLKTRWYDLTAGHYIDEFSENHSKDMLVRERLSRTIPSAGVGCAFSRRTFELVAKSTSNQLFNIDSLTEDYDFGLRLWQHKLRQVFVRQAITRTALVKSAWTGKSRSVETREYIVTREFFPRTFRMAVRQKARWIVGIALQGWATLGWGGSGWTKYMLYRDRKGLVTNQIHVLGYVVFGVVLLLWLGPRLFPGSYRYPSLVEGGSWLYYLLLANAGFLTLRTVQRMLFVAHFYGFAQALLTLPRLVWGNLINFVATGRAVYLFGRYLFTGRLIPWDKTAHAFPTEGELRSYRRRLGDLLLERRFINVRQLDEALETQKRVNRPLGAILVEMGLVQEGDLIRLLGTQLQLSTREIDPYETLLEVIRALPRELAVRYSVYPVELRPGGRLVVATNNPLGAAELMELQRALNRRVEVCLSTRSDISFAIRRGYERLSAPEEAPGGRVGARLEAERLVGGEELRAALAVQRRSYARLGDILLAENMVAAPALKEAVAIHAATGGGPFGEFLVEHGYATREQLSRALQLQATRFRRLGDVLVEKGQVSRLALERALGTEASA